MTFSEFAWAQICSCRNWEPKTIRALIVREGWHNIDVNTCSVYRRATRVLCVENNACARSHTRFMVSLVVVICWVGICLINTFELLGSLRNTFHCVDDSWRYGTVLCNCDYTIFSYTHIISGSQKETHQKGEATDRGGKSRNPAHWTGERKVPKCM